jgi:nucleotide-binding universal stress UspA family protein
MSRSILVAIDGSSHSAAAAREAIAIAVRDGARLTLIHVLGRPRASFIAGPYMPPPLPVINSAEAETLLDEIASTVPEGTPVHTIVRDGNPADEILKRAEGSQHDLIVMGSRGHGGAASLLLGSVSRSVIHRSTVPVIVVHVDGERVSTELHHPTRLA